MFFKMDCPHCKRTLKITKKAFGKTVPCPGCSKPVKVPQQPKLFRIVCPHCNRVLNATEKTFGKTIPCPGCKQPVMVPPQPAKPHLLDISGAQSTPQCMEPALASADPTTTLPAKIPPLPSSSMSLSLSAEEDGNGGSSIAGSMGSVAQIKLPCPFCGDSIKYDESLGGKTIVCGYCKKPLTMPSVAQLAPEYQDELRRMQDKVRKKLQAAESKRLKAEQKEEAKRQAQIAKQEEAERRAEESRFQQEIEANRQQQHVTAISNSVPSADVAAQPTDTNNICCPKCGCTQLSTAKKGMSGGSACCGALLFGPIGVLCGLQGANKVVVTCLKCGYQWTRG